MPVQFGKDADGCFAQWGEAGKPYYFECGNDAAQAAAAAKAQQQGAAIEANTAQADDSADVAVDGAIEVAIEPTPDEPAPPKHIKIRLNDPAHFSAYQTMPYRRTPDGKNDTESDGVQVSYGVWFQSTRPRGARLSAYTVYVKPLAVSIHAPARGATCGVIRSSQR